MAMAFLESRAKPRCIIGLVPRDEQIVKALTQYSHSRFPRKEGIDGYQLGGASHPHASVLQFEFDGEFDESTRRFIDDTIKAETDTFTVTLKPTLYKKPDGYCELRFHPDEGAVQALHNRLLDLLRARGLETKNAHGDRYTPHFTLAKLYPDKDADTIQEESIGLPPELSGPITCHLTWGHADQRWQMVNQQVLRADPTSSPSPDA